MATERQPRCLVVNEDHLLRWSLVRFLEARGLEARSVGSGELALSLLQEWQVDLLISDDCPAGMPSLELARRCQTLQPRPQIILLTGGEGAPPQGDLERLGVVGVIEKPFILDSLARLLDGVLRQSGGATA